MFFWRFQLNSVTISLTTNKAAKVKDACVAFLHNLSPTIREVSQDLGLLTSSMPGVMYGPIHYRSLGMKKTMALQGTRGNYDQSMTLSSSEKHDLNWWVNNVETAYNVVSHGEPALTMTTDASKTGWGCSLHEVPTGGHWTPEEASEHINFFEIKAVLLGLQSFVDKVSSQHVKVLIDNTTAVSCINQMGTCHSEKLNCIVIEIWGWCIQHDVWLAAAHIPGAVNIIADQESRKISSDLEWALDIKIYKEAVKLCDFPPNIDLFASRLHTKCQHYISYHPDPGAQAVNAFTLSWCGLHFYAFPSFSIILKTLRKIRKDEATGILVVPHWH